ncbi:MAG: hypothetical protein E7515_02520 [Ruminococcaceae bacterium]|jgi:hypothetical protein|nr:hypothetical protein [Oscillospiraceae bacterium]
MKSVKKTFAIILTAVMMLFMFTVVAFADDAKHTVTFDYNGHGDKYELEIEDGKSLYDILVELTDDRKASDEVHAGMYAEVDEDGVYYRVKGYYTDKECKNSYNSMNPVTEDITVYAKWEERIDEVIITVVPPEDGKKVETPENDWASQSYLPEVSLPDGAPYYFRRYDNGKDDPARYWWAKGPEGGSNAFNDTFESGKEYQALLWLATDKEHYFSSSLKVTVINGKWVKDESELDTINPMICISAVAVDQKAEEKTDERADFDKKTDKNENEIPHTGKAVSPLNTVIIAFIGAFAVTLTVLRKRIGVKSVKD